MDEQVLSGFCRCQNASRMVTVEIESGKLSDVDCSYENCPYTGACTIGSQIAELLK